MKHSFRSQRLSIRLMTLLLVLCFLPLLPAAPVNAEDKPVTNLFGSALKDYTDFILSQALVGDTLYIRTKNNLYAFGPGDVKARLVTAMPYPNFLTGKEQEEGYQPQISTILTDGQRLLGFEPLQGTLYQLELEGETVSTTKLVSLDLTDFIQGEGVYQRLKSIDWLLLFGGRLYIKFSNYDDPVDLYSFDLETGERKAHQVNHLASPTLYKDGSLLVLQVNPADNYDPETGEPRVPEVLVFNPQDDSLSPYGIAMPFTTNGEKYAGMYYDGQEDALYTYSDTEVYRISGGEAEVIGYLPMYGIYHALGNGGVQPLPDGRLALGFGSNVFLRERTAAGLEGLTTLVLGGGLDDPGILADALMETDDLIIQQAPADYKLYSQEALAALFLTGSVDLDLLVIDANSFDMDKLMEKGYLADLSGSAKIKGFLAEVAPNLSKSFMKDSAIYALPVAMLSFPGIAYTQRFEELGLQVPTSLTGLIDLFERWLTGLGEEQPDYTLTTEHNLKDLLIRTVLEKYVDNRLAERELTFDTPEFRSLMERVMALPYGEFDREVDWEDPQAAAAAGEMFNKKALLEFDMGFEPRYAMGVNNRGERSYVPLTLSIKEGEEPREASNYTMLVALSTSQKLPQTIRFLEHLIDKLNQADKAAIIPGQTQAIENPGFEAEIAQSQRNLEDMRDRLSRAEGAQRSDLEKYLKEREEAHERYKEDMRYLATEEDLAMVHRMVSALFVPTGLVNAQYQAFRDSYDLRNQYQQGAITLNQFIKQMDDMLRLVRMEYQ